MKTVRIGDESHKRLVKVAGRLQAASGRGKSLDAAIAALSMCDEIFTDYEVGLELSHLLHDRGIPKEQAFLWFWGLASLAKYFQDSYGFDSLMKYALTPAVRYFSDCLNAEGSSELDPDIFRYFEKQNETPTLVRRFVEKCGDDGFGNYVRMGRLSLTDLRWYLKYIICYENGQWQKTYVDNIDKAMMRSEKSDYDLDQ